MLRIYTQVLSYDCANMLNTGSNVYESTGWNITLFPGLHVPLDILTHNLPQHKEYYMDLLFHSKHTCPTATGRSSQLIWITLDPQPAVIGEDVQIRCTHNISSVINYHPWIVVDGETTTLNTLTSQENYSLNKSALIDGQAVYVVIMHNVRASDNGTRFECYFRFNGGEEIRSGTVALRVRHEGEGSYICMRSV